MAGQINYRVGDAAQPCVTEPAIIAHITNNVGAWGAGFTKSLNQHWPRTQVHYRIWFGDMKEWIVPPLEKNVLGHVKYVKYDEPGMRNPIWIANMAAQDGLRGARNPRPVRYDALGQCLKDVGLLAETVEASVHMPRIGCGLGGGDWNIVEALINDAMVRQGIDVYVYDLETRQ